MKTMDEALAESFGEVLRRARLASGATQDDLAEAADVPRSNISRMESGAHMPTLATLSRVADALGVDFGRFVAKVIRGAKKRVEKSQDETE